MRRLRQSRPSPALLIAIVALIAALAGTAIAADPVANTSALTKKKVKKIVKKQINKLAPGLSVANADNATNADNAQNAENSNQLGGVAADAYLRNVEIVTAQSASNSSNKSVTATCPAGKVLVGGGARERTGLLAPSATVAIVASGPSHPILGSPSNTAWTATGEEYAPDPDNWRILAYAICAEG